LANRASRRHDEARAPNTFNRAVVRSNKRVEASASLAQYDAPADRHDARALICVDPQAAARIDDPVFDAAGEGCGKFNAQALG
jgi:hypothetical protein